jgi:hypothetical protein
VLSRERILSLFAELDSELCRTGTRGDVFIVGGAAMTLAYDARPATRDVDGIWHPSAEVRAAAVRVAARHDDIEPEWLNDAVKGFLPAKPKGPTTVVYDGDCLIVSVPAPEYLLATKLLASRVGRDEDDIRLLYRLAGLTTVDEGLALIERYYPGRPIEATRRLGSRTSGDEGRLVGGGEGQDRADDRRGCAHLRFECAQADGHAGLGVVAAEVDVADHGDHPRADDLQP